MPISVTLHLHVETIIVDRTDQAALGNVVANCIVQVILGGFSTVHSSSEEYQGVIALSPALTLPHTAEL